MIGQSVGPFRVVGKLGAGGMGEVYLAEDTRLGRKVALKSPSESWLRDPDARLRLHREARAAARLNHPRIAAVYDVLDLDGRSYIVMEYVEGETLAACLRKGPLTVDRAVALGIQLADALVAAHEGGVIHRDLKPGNIVLTAAGSIKVLDFGLAKTAHLDDESKSNLTHPGQLLGTPGYVAPEQLLGTPADERSDIYSAGAVLYQMLTGRPPFEQTESMGRALAALMEKPRPVEQVNPAIPPAVSAVVERAMAREPAERYQTAAEMRAALEQAAAGLHDSPTHLVGMAAAPPRRRIAEIFQVIAAVLLLLAVAGLPILRWWNTREYPGTAHAATPVIAVLPFDNLSGDPALQYLGAGMAETIGTRLASVVSLSVIPRSQIREALDGTAGRVDRISKALGASYVVTGAIQKTGPLLQVTVNLLTPDGRTVPGSGEVFEEDSANVFSLQRRIAQSLSDRLVGGLSDSQQQQIARAPTSSVDALTSYWRGRELLDEPSRAGAIDGAITHFREAITRDPKFGLAYAGLADAFRIKYDSTKDPDDARAALSAVEQARSRTPDDPQVRLSLAQSYQLTGRIDDAIRELSAVLAARPNNDDAHRLIGSLYGRQGRDDDAINHFQRAIAIRPDYWRNHSSLGAYYYRNGRFASAGAEFERVTQLQPNSSWGYLNLGAAYHAAGDLARAADNYKRAIAIAPTDSAYSNLGAALHQQGRYDEAIAAYNEAIRLSPGNPVYQRNVGDAYRGKRDEAHARAAYEEAIALTRRMLSVNSADAATLSLQALCEAKVSRTADARNHIAAALRLSPDDPDVLTKAAAIEAMAGNRQAALDYCERAIAHGASRQQMREDDDFRALRNDPAFVRVTSGGPS